MTRETYCVAVLVPALVADWLAPQAWLHGLIGFAALGFLICQARIVYAARGIPAWRAPLIPWLLTSTGLLEGLGLIALTHALFQAPSVFAPGMAATGAVLAFLTGTLWIAYRWSARAQGLGPLARDAIDRAAPIVSVVGHAIPLAALVVLTSAAPNSASHLFASVAAGAGAVLGGIVCKVTLITRAGHQQSFALPKLPRRGSGTRAR
jgi:phenylacetyl-CoA:acceptor oxidoreductase subunit 2